MSQLQNYYKMKVSRNVRDAFVYPIKKNKIFGLRYRLDIPKMLSISKMFAFVGMMIGSAMSSFIFPNESTFMVPGNDYRIEWNSTDTIHLQYQMYG